MADTGLERVRNLIKGSSTAQPIVENDPDREAVGLFQDLLATHTSLKQTPVVDIRNKYYGLFGPATKKALRRFRQEKMGIKDAKAPVVADSSTLYQLTHLRASNPIFNRGYLTLVLEYDFDPLMYLMSLTTLWESNGEFTKGVDVKDGAGLSYGVIQWAQSQGRLDDIVLGFQTADEEAFNNVFDPVLGPLMLKHVQKPGGGLDSNGHTTDPKFNLTDSYWRGRFRAAGLLLSMQIAQVEIARLAYIDALKKVRGFAPAITSQRGIAFMLDMYNQHGARTKQFYDEIFNPALKEKQLLLLMRDKSVEWFSKPKLLKFRAGVKTRRDFFLNTELLNDQPFDFNPDN